MPDAAVIGMTASLLAGAMTGVGGGLVMMFLDLSLG